MGDVEPLGHLPDDVHGLVDPQLLLRVQAVPAPVAEVQRHRNADGELPGAMLGLVDELGDGLGGQGVQRQLIQPRQVGRERGGGKTGAAQG